MRRASHRWGFSATSEAAVVMTEKEWRYKPIVDLVVVVVLSVVIVNEFVGGGDDFS